MPLARIAGRRYCPASRSVSAWRPPVETLFEPTGIGDGTRPDLGDFLPRRPHELIELLGLGERAPRNGDDGGRSDPGTASHVVGLHGLNRVPEVAGIDPG